MLRNYLAATLRGLARDRLHTAITTLSLAIGFAAVILASTFHRFETGYDRFWPEHERLYLVAQWQPQEDPKYVLTSDAATIHAKDLILAYAPEVEAITHLTSARIELSRGRTVTPQEPVYWAEANFFDLLKPRAVAGDLATALSAPRSVVLTESMARKYFGDRPALGQSLTMGDATRAMPLRVTAVIEDLPENTHLSEQIFISASTIGGFKTDPDSPGASVGLPGGPSAYTYVRTRPGVDREALARSLLEISQRHLAAAPGRPDPLTLKPSPIDEVYMKGKEYREIDGGEFNIGGVREGNFERLRLVSVIAALILLVATINFVTLMTARGAKRAVEVGVRKASGARRRDLVVQFLGESIVFAIFSFVVALALAEMAEPMIREMTGARLQIRYLADLPFFLILFLTALGIGIAAGLYPAFALSSFKPAAVLKGGPARAPGSARLRAVLVAVQFTPLIVLGLFAASTQAQLTRTHNASLSNLPGNPLMLDAPCTAPFRQKLAALEGVEEVACMNVGGWFSISGFRGLMIGRPAMGGTVFDAATKPMERSFPTRVSAAGLRFHKQKLIAGREPTDQDEARNGAEVVITEGLRRKLGFDTPRAALGREVTWRDGRKAATSVSTVVGVIADRPGFPDGETNLFIPTPLPPQGGDGIGVRPKEGADRAALLEAVDALWTAEGNTPPLERNFYADRIARMAQNETRQLTFIYACLAVGALVGALGLFGLAAFLAEQRTKEIGVRKAMGAGSGQVMSMLLVQFAAPVMAAGVLACPAAFALITWMQREDSVASRSPMGIGVIAPVVTASLALALLATFIHALRMATARPVTALRYE